MFNTFFLAPIIPLWNHVSAAKGMILPSRSAPVD
jgi:hypothetical protein